jgi:hypothetical protein
MNMNTIFPITLPYDFIHLQFMLDVYGKIAYNDIKLLNIINRGKIMPNLSIDFFYMCMLRIEKV